ncbi:MAG: putative rane protein [Moraxellaceae bacterium]|jgi:uncharacterized membrane protein YoaK (UPF0700 family)|nr:putative rane protein [Moraxellaceae bacterium]
MPLIYLRHLTARERTPRANRHLGRVLAFVAGAANAGGFLAVQQYTSHMTGVVSAMADHIALGQFAMALGGSALLVCFVLGSMVTALLVNWARDRDLHSQFAMPLLLEAVLLLLFGSTGHYIQEQIPLLYVSWTVLLLCFMMGLQNAIITKASNAEIRTTHVTGLVTDIGIGLGRLLYWQGHEAALEQVEANRQRLRLHGSLVLMFFLGGVIGASGFKSFGFLAALPLALLLLLLSALPVLEDLRTVRS